MTGNTTGGNKGAAKRLGIPIEEWEAQKAKGLLWCYVCRTWKEHWEFGVDRSRRSGRASCCSYPCNSEKSTASRYGMKFADFRALKEKQKGICPICKRGGEKMEIDHDHDTKKVRGLLCSRCNGALGQFCDDVNLLSEATKYLERHNGRAH